MRENPGPLTKGRIFTFSRRKDRFVAATFMKLCSLVFPDEAELTNFLKNKITEPLYSNLLPVLTYPETLFHFQLSESRLAETFSEEVNFPQISYRMETATSGFSIPVNQAQKLQVP